VALGSDRAVRHPTRAEERVGTLLGGGALSLLSVPVVPAVLLSGYLLALSFGYVPLVGLTNYAHTGRAAAAFDPIRAAAPDGDYAVRRLYGVVALLVSGVVAGLLGAVPLLGVVAGAFVGFYGRLVAAWLRRRGFGAATDRRPPTGRTATLKRGPAGVGV